MRVCVRARACRETYAYGAPCMQRRGDDGILSWRILVDVRVESAVARRQLACPFVCELSAGALLTPRNDSDGAPAAIVPADAGPNRGRERVPSPSSHVRDSREKIGLEFACCPASPSLPRPHFVYSLRSIVVTDGFSVNFKRDIFIPTPVLQPSRIYPISRTRGRGGGGGGGGGVRPNVFAAEGVTPNLSKSAP